MFGGPSWFIYLYFGLFWQCFWTIWTLVDLLYTYISAGNLQSLPIMNLILYTKRIRKNTCTWDAVKPLCSGARSETAPSGVPQAGSMQWVAGQTAGYLRCWRFFKILVWGVWNVWKHQHLCFPLRFAMNNECLTSHPPRLLRRAIWLICRKEAYDSGGKQGSSTADGKKQHQRVDPSKQTKHRKTTQGNLKALL